VDRYVVLLRSTSQRERTGGAETMSIAPHEHTGAKYTDCHWKYETSGQDKKMYYERHVVVSVRAGILNRRKSRIAYLPGSGRCLLLLDLHLHHVGGMLNHFRDVGMVP
jgi:hypothetical protein